MESVRITEEIRKRLSALAETDYKEFNQKLLPGTENVIGIRLPALRKLAKEIAKNGFREYLDECREMTLENSFHEEIMLQGMVLGYAKMDREERRTYLNEFVPKIANWAVCDSCVTGYKFMEKEPEYWFDYLLRFRDSKKEFELRFMIVAMMSHFVDAEHIDEILRCCGQIRNDGYYTKMGVAWTVQVCYVKFPEKTRQFLENDAMDDFTHNKAIQKIRESYRVSREEKEELNRLKRKQPRG